MLLIGLCGLVLPAGAASPTTTLVSVNQAGTASGNDESLRPVITPDGRRVAFTSKASDLTADNDPNAEDDIFVRDLKKGTTTLVSVNQTGTASGNDFSFEPVITPNGRFVAFASFASDLAANDTIGTQDVFVRDLKKGTTTLVSLNQAGTASGNADSFRPAIATSGRFVLFESVASDLTTNADSNAASDVFLRDLKKGTTALVSVNQSGSSGNSFSFGPVMSENRRFVVFVSVASDLTADNDANANSDVFVRDLKKGTTTLVSLNQAGTASSNGFSQLAAVSLNGRFVAFSSNASDLAANDTNSLEDVFVRDLKKGTTTLVSVNQAGTGGGNNNSSAPAITPNGRFVAFVSGASDLAANDTNGNRDVFVRDLKTGTTTLVSVNQTGTASGNGESVRSVISSNGRFVAFDSRASDLVAADTNGKQDVFIRDLKTGTTTLVSVNSAGSASGNDDSVTPIITPNGSSAAFESLASDLVANDTNGATDVFVRQLK